MGLPTVAVYSDCDRDARHVREADEAVPHRPERGRARATCASTRSSTPRGASGADAVHPGLRVPRRERRVRRAPARDAGLTFIGPSPDAIALMGSKTAARDAAIARRRAGRARHRASRSTTRRATPTIARGGRRDRLSAAGQGGGRRRRQGHARRSTTPTTCSAAVATARSEAGSAFGDTRRLPRAADRAAAAHRDPAARRSPRHRRAVRRARVLDPAAPSEGGRGVAVARGDAGRCARRMAARRGRRRARGRLHQRRHDRVPARRGRLVLLPRDEHAAAGRASGHRDGDRHRPGAVADPDRARRAARRSIRRAR